MCLKTKCNCCGKEFIVDIFTDTCRECRIKAIKERYVWKMRKNNYEDLEDRELIKVAENIIDEAKMLFFLKWNQEN